MEFHHTGIGLKDLGFRCCELQSFIAAVYAIPEFSGTGGPGGMCDTHAHMFGSVGSCVDGFGLISDPKPSNRRPENEPYGRWKLNSTSLNPIKPL